MSKTVNYLLLSAAALVTMLAPSHLAAAVRAISVSDLNINGPEMNGVEVEVKGFTWYTGGSVFNLSETNDLGGAKVAVQLDEATAAARKYLITNCSQTAAQGQVAPGKLGCAMYVSGRVELYGSFLSVHAKTIASASATGPITATGSSGEPSGDTSCLVGAQFGVPETNARRAFAKDQSAIHADSTSDHMDQSHHAAFQRAYDKQVGILRGAGPVSTTPPASGITQTPLSCFFARHPFQGTGTEWPRVAITILSAPPGWGELVAAWDMPTNTCWNMRAKIWFNQMDSQDVPPFQWCWGEMSLGLSFEIVPVWGGHTQFNMMNASRGGKRTDGPWSPGASLPDDGTNREKFSFMTYSNYFTGSVLHRMGLDWNKGDGRVWFNLGF